MHPVKLGLKNSLYNFSSNCTAVHEICIFLSCLELFIVENPAFSTLLGDMARKPQKIIYIYKKLLTYIRNYLYIYPGQRLGYNTQH